MNTRKGGDVLKNLVTSLMIETAVDSITVITEFHLYKNAQMACYTIIDFRLVTGRAMYTVSSYYAEFISSIYVYLKLNNFQLTSKEHIE